MSRAIHTDDAFETSDKKVMNADDRRKFVIYLFETFDSLDKTSKKKAAKQCVEEYRKLHNDLKVNEMWVYRLLLAGIYKDENGNFGFDNIDCDFEEMIAKPSILEKKLKVSK